MFTIDRIYSILYLNKSQYSTSDILYFTDFFMVNDKDKKEIKETDYEGELFTMEEKEKQPHSLLSRRFTEMVLLIHNYFYRQGQIPIPLNQFCVLVMLQSRDTACISELCSTLHLSKQQMTTIVEKLTTIGYIERHSDPDDRRRSLLSITTSGRQLLELQDDCVRERFDQRLARLSPQQIDALDTSMQILNESVEKMFS